MQIILPHLLFYARHGVLPQEREVGGRFEVSLTIELDEIEAGDALLTDHLEGTVNYAEVYRVVREEMDISSALLEHVVHRLCRRLLRDFPLIRKVRVALTKLTPPIPRYDGAGVSVARTMARNLVIWDFDGTLADTFPGIIRTMNATFRAHSLSEETEEKIVSTIGLPLKESMVRLKGVDDKKSMELAETYRDLFETLGAPATRLMPGAKECVKALAAIGCFQCVATSRGHRSVTELLERLGLLSYMEHIIAVEDVSEAKPAPEAVLTLCHKTGVSPEDATVVGDAPFDMEMARRAGVPRRWAVGGDTRALNQAGSTRIFPNITDLLSYIKRESLFV